MWWNFGFRRTPARPASAKSSGGVDLPLSGGGFPFIYGGARASLGGEREDLVALVRHADRVLELRRERAVAGDRGPAVAQDLHRVAAEIDHRLSGQEHAGFQHDALTGPAVMHDVGKRVEDAPEPVAAEVAHHRAALLVLGEGLDGVADVARRGARLHHGDAAHHGVIRDLDQTLRFALHLADVIHAARVAVPAIEHDGHVDVEDVAVFQGPVARDAVTDDVIDRGAERVAIAAIAETGRQRAVRDRVFVGDLVERGGGYAGPHFRDEEIEHFGGEPSGVAHALEIFGPGRGDGKGRAAGGLQWVCNQGQARGG